MKKPFLFIFICLFILGPALLSSVFAGQSTWPQEYRKQVTTRVYQLPYEKVFDIVFNFCDDSALPLSTKDKEEGIIVTEAMSGGPVLMGQESFDFRITKLDDNSTRVRLYIHYDYNQGRDGKNIDNFITEYDYEDVFNAINKAVKKAQQ